MQPGDGTQKRSESSQERIARARGPRRVGKYAVEGELGTGAFGRVFRCHDADLDRHVAVKVLKDELITPANREQLVADFLNEARAVARIKHHFVCEVYDVGLDDGVPFLVMPLVESGTLREWMAANPLPPLPTALGLVRDVALGLDAAHRKGIVHRDVKPANVLWDADAGRVLVTDFGLAKLVDSTVTVSVYKGTPLYMSPEQWRPGKPHKLGPASDVYSLGVVLYQLLTGTFPFGPPDGDPLGYGMAVCLDEPRPPSAVLPHLDPALDALVLTALAKAPGDRYSSAKAFADALESHRRRAAEEDDRRAKAEPPPPPPAAHAVAAVTEAAYQMVMPGVDALFRLAGAAAPTAEAEYQEGRLHSQGRGVPRNYAKARECFERAAARGHAAAQHDLGFLYHYGHGTAPDYAKACAWYEKAAAQGHADAQYILGAMYLGGYGVPKDADKARGWYEKAAAQGHKPAKAALDRLTDKK